MKALKAGLLVAALAFATFAVAQDSSQQGGMGPGNMPSGQHMPTVDQRVAHLTKTLNLNSSQQQQVRSILQDQHSQMQQTSQDQSLSQQERRAKMMDIHKNTEAKINSVLNDQQKAQYQEMRQKQQEQMRQHMQEQGQGQGQSQGQGY